MKGPQNIVEKGNEIINSLDFTNVTPDKEYVLRFLEIEPKNIKIVIIGQDPYPTLGVANGRAFAVNKGCALPQSLKNIFKEIKEIQGEVFTDETLELWAKQGVLLLNASLTTIVGQPNAHKNIGREYTQEIVNGLDENLTITGVLGGNEAKAIGKSFKNTKIEDVHPSPLSVRNRNKTTFKTLATIKG